jgi:hypothetical protein
MVKLHSSCIFKEVSPQWFSSEIVRWDNSLILTRLNVICYDPFISGHVLKTFPASIPATVTPVMILKATKCKIKIIFPLALNVSLRLANVMSFS